MLLRAISKPFLAIATAAVLIAVILAATTAGETPVGTVKGIALAAETGKPIAEASVILESKGADEENKYHYTQTDEDGQFQFTQIPAGDYEIRANATVHSMEAADVTVREAQTQNLSLEMKPGEPYLYMYANEHVFTSKQKPEVVLDGFTKSDVVTVGLYKVDIDRLYTDSNEALKQLFNRDGSGIYNSEKLLETSDAIEWRSTLPVQIKKRDSEGCYHQRTVLHVPKPGLYIVVSSTDGVQSSTGMSVSDISLVSKNSGNDLLAYVVRLDTGQPIQGATIKVYDGDSVTETGTTDPRGIWRKTLSAPKTGSENRLIVAQSGDSVAFVHTYNSEESQGQPTSFYTYTDRPVYRPGQIVWFKSIVRQFQGSGYKSPPQGNVQVEINDPRGSMIYSKSLPLSSFGSVHGGIKLPDYAPTGEYSIECSYGGENETASFEVAEYRKPEFTVSVQMPKKRCVRGERIKAVVKASYYFGAPVANTEVTYSVSRSDYWFWMGEDENAFSESGYEDYGGYGENVTSGTVKTGPDGTAEITFDADWPETADSYNVVDQQITVYASVTEANGQSSESQGSIIATQGDFAVQVSPEEYVSKPGKASQVVISATDYKGRPQSGIEMHAEASRVGWDEEEEEETYADVAKSNVKTGSDGKAYFTFTPDKAGYYRIGTECRDRNGNVIKSAGWVWVSGDEDFEGYNYPDLGVVLDKKTYNPGDTAKVLINSKEVGETALLTIEGKKLFDYKLVKLDSRSTVVEIPVTADYRPNFFVSVCYVKDKKFITQEVGAKVSLGEKLINLTVTSDKDRYEPGENATYSIKAVDADGKPVQAELSLGVVDESIYAIKEDDTRPIKEFFYSPRENAVQTRYSFPEIYLSGDKAGYSGPIRKKFVDTAYWNPTIVTDANGEAKISLRMPDNLTTWRATARACSASTAVGQCISKCIVTKKLLVRLETPRFLVEKDEAEISAIVHNYMRGAQAVTVRIETPGMRILDDRSVNVIVEKGGMQKIRWRVMAPKAGSVTVTASATSRAAGDAMQLTLPVRPHGQRLIETRAGTVTKYPAVERMVVRADAVHRVSQIRIRLAPSIASTMLGSLDYLAQYPYGCTEQTMSCFLPDVVIWQNLKSLSIQDAKLQEQLPDMVGKGLNKLYEAQNSSGSWGWCNYSQGDLWMTAYVVYGLVTAKQAGFDVDQDVLDNGINALTAQVSNRLISHKEMAHAVYGMYVLSAAEKTEFVSEHINSILQQNIETPREIAYLVMTLQNIGDQARAMDYLNFLWSKAIVTGGDIHWTEQDVWYSNIPTETTATALTAILKLTPDDSRIPKIVRWLVDMRTGNHWSSTRDTAITLYALSEYLKHSGELQPNFTATVWHNGRKVTSVHFDKKSIFQPEQEIIIPGNEIGMGDHYIRIGKEGQGTLYYSVELLQYVERPEKVSTITGSAITVTRNYYKLIPGSGPYRSGLEPSSKSSTNFRVGDSIKVRLIVHSPKAYEHVLVEDYLPAGCEASDRGRVEAWEWTNWWVAEDVRDERVSFYVENLKPGKNVLKYDMRASTPGTYHALAPLVQAMYQPEVTSSGTEMTVKIRE